MTPWLVCRRPKPAARARLICFPCAGGSPASFWAWEAILPDDVELHVALLPGRGPRLGEPPVANLAALAEPLAVAVRPLAAMGPYALFGHSMGAMLAYAVALRLAEARAPTPRLLAVAAHRAPGQRRAESRSGLSGRSDDELVAWLAALGGTPAAALADPDLMQLVLPPLRADLAAVESYTPPDGARLACDVAAFCGDADPGADARAIAGWEAVTTGAARVATLAGGHFFVEAQAPALIKVLLEALLAP